MEFISGDKRANKSVNTKNYELFRSSNLEERHRAYPDISKEISGAR